MADGAITTWRWRTVLRRRCLRRVRFPEEAGVITGYTLLTRRRWA
jgi:hypothetical protein